MNYANSQTQFAFTGQNPMGQQMNMGQPFNGQMNMGQPVNMGVNQGMAGQMNMEQMNTPQPVNMNQMNTPRQRILTDENGEPLPAIDISNAEVVRREMFAHTKESSVTIRPDGIQFNNACIERFEDVTHILMLVDWDKNWLIIKGCDKDDKDGQRWCTIKTDKRKTRKLKGNAFAKLLYERLGWCKGNYYKICGTLAVQQDKQDELLMVFKFAEREECPMTRKSRENAGIMDSELTREQLDALDEFELQKQIEKEEREAAKAKGEKAPKSSRAGKFPAEWEGTMGTPFSQYEPKVEFPHLPENNEEAAQMGFGVFTADSGAGEQ